MRDALCVPSEDVIIKDVTKDSRKARSGSLFFAIPGGKVNGEDYISDAVKNGASAVVVSVTAKSEMTDGIGVPVVRVHDVKGAFAIACARFSGCDKIGKTTHLTAVTGTNGKSTTAYMLAHILSATGHKTAVIGTLGCGFFGEVTLTDGMTTPSAECFYPMLAEFAKNGAEHIVFEASSQGIAEGRLFGIPHSAFLTDTAVFTNLSPDHLDYHSSMEEYFEVKKSLFRDYGFRNFVINGKDGYGKRLYGEFGGISVGDGDFFVKRIISSDELGVRYSLLVNGRDFDVKCPAPGRFTAENSSLAIAAAVTLGISIDDAVFALEKFGGVPGRMEMISDEPFVLIDFAHTPKALTELMETVRGFSRGRKITLLFGCGGDRDRSKRPLMGRIAATLADRIVITSDNSRTEKTEDIINEIMNGVPTSVEYTVIPSRHDAIEYALVTAEKDEMIVLAGKGHEDYEDIGGVKIPFSERDIVRTVMKKIKGNG